MRVGRTPRLDKLWFDPAELRQLVLAARHDEPVTLSAMARKLHVDRKTLLWMASRGDTVPLLHLAPCEGNTGDMSRLSVTAEEFRRFQATFVTLAALATERGVSKLDLARRLSAHGIRSVGYPERPTVQVFRRKDVEGLL